MTDMAGPRAEIVELDEYETTFATPRREHLTLVREPRVVFTYADDVELRTTGPLWRRRQRRFPAGLVHAAVERSTAALCGTPLETLEAFGRRRHPFEGFDVTVRCTACDLAAEGPVG
jgi:hypothetical protein